MKFSICKKSFFVGKATFSKRMYEIEEHIMVDPRKNKTEQTIVNAFFELLELYDIQHISIKKICNQAQISRSTFYDHYIDYPYFIETLENKVVDKYIECMNVYNYDTNTDSFIDVLFQVIKENRSLFSFMFDEKLNGNTKEKFVQRIKDLCFPRWEKESNISKEKLEIIYTYMMNGSLSILALWYNKKNEIDEREFKELYVNVIKYGVYNYIYTV